MSMFSRFCWPTCVRWKMKIGPPRNSDDRNQKSFCKIPSAPESISIKTASRWMKFLRFISTQHYTKGYYTDGHNRRMLRNPRTKISSHACWNMRGECKMLCKNQNWLMMNRALSSLRTTRAPLTAARGSLWSGWKMARTNHEGDFSNGERFLLPMSWYVS